MKLITGTDASGHDFEVRAGAIDGFYDAYVGSHGDVIIGGQSTSLRWDEYIRIRDEWRAWLMTPALALAPAPVATPVPAPVPTPVPVMPRPPLRTTRR